jgi:YVTN family beta-propeller protein
MGTSQFIRNKRWLHVKYGVLIVIISLSILLLASDYGYSEALPSANETVYLPVTATNSRTGPPPVFVASVELEGARCPIDITINQATNNVFIANEFSDDISILRGSDFLGNVATGIWPTRIESDPLSSIIYVSHIVSGVTVLDNGVVIGNIEPYSESFAITINKLNGYTYVTDLGGPISIIEGTQKVKDLFAPDYGGQKINWQLTSAYDNRTGLTYFASWEEDAMTIVDGLEVVDQFPYFGQGANDIVIDSYRRLMYVANLRAHQDGPYTNNISIIDLNTYEVKQIWTADNSRNVAMDPVSGYVYITNTSSDSVTVLRGKEVIATYNLGKEPYGVTVDPVTGFAFVANSGELSVSVLRDGRPITKIELPENKGTRPNLVAVDPISHQLYVVSRSSRVKHGDNTLNRIECKDAWVNIYQ